MIKNMTKQEKIQELKKEKDAVILAHYYVETEVQKEADYVGDSYYLSKVAAELDNKILVFCGVSFMGESGKLLSPNKKVLMPDSEADCPMAHMVKKEDVEAARASWDDLAVVCYVNSTAEIKSWSDVCVTSANAVKIVKNLPNKNIFFIPDKNLARYVAEQVPEKNIVIHDGYCPVHEHMKAGEIEKLQKNHPQAKVLAHPECNQEILKLADYIGSTSGILQYAQESEEKEFIIATEAGVLYELELRRPDAQFYFTETMPVCPGMKLNTLDGIIEVLEKEDNQIQVPEELAEAAGGTLTRMLELAAEKRR